MEGYGSEVRLRRGLPTLVAPAGAGDCDLLHQLLGIGIIQKRFSSKSKVEMAIFDSDPRLLAALLRAEGGFRIGLPGHQKEPGRHLLDRDGCPGP